MNKVLAEAIAKALGWRREGLDVVEDNYSMARGSGRTTHMKLHVLTYVLEEQPKVIVIVSANMTWSERIVDELKRHLADLKEKGFIPTWDYSVQICPVSDASYLRTQGLPDDAIFHDHTFFEHEIRELEEQVKRVKERLHACRWQGRAPRRW